MNPDFKQMIQTLLPDPSEQEAYFAAFQNPLKKSLSINRHRDPEFEAHNPDFQLSQSVFGLHDSLYVDRADTTIALGKTRQHLTGEFYIQEVAASLPANILKGYLDKLYTQSGQAIIILDIAAAPGGKTAQVASYMLAQHIPGVVRGNDIEFKRLKSWTQNIQRCGLYNTLLSKTDGTQFGRLYPEFFDAILVDAPCSGEGTGFKSEDAFKRRRQESINEIAGLQSQILDSAFKACKVGGLVIYSTCTLNPYENEYQIAQLITRYGDAVEILPIDLPNTSSGLVVDESLKSGEEDKMLRAWPHIHHSGGFFVCVIRKKSPIDNPETVNPRQSGQLPFEYHAGLERQLIRSIEQVYGITIDTHHYALIEGKHHIYLADASVKSLLSDGLWFQEVGIPILKKSGRSYSLEHGFGLVLGDQAQNHSIELSTDQLQDYVLGNDITVSDDQVVENSNDSFDNFNKFYLLKHHGKGVGVGKLNKGFIKNKFLRW